MLVVTQATKDDSDCWQQFITRKGADHYSYDWRWRAIIKNVFKHEPFFLIAKEGEEVVGILPLFLVKSFLFGKALISIPYMNGGGLLSDNDRVTHLLIKEANKLSNLLDVKYTEFRLRAPLSDKIKEDTTLDHKSHKVAMILKLERDPEILFQKFSPKLRSQIRKPTKDGFVAESEKGQDISDKSIQDFYQVFSQTMKTLGTPVYPQNLFRETIRAFGDRARLTVVRIGGLPVAGGITIGTTSGVEIPWAASLRKYSKSAPNMLLYWETIKNCCFDGYSTFDFGRSSIDSGTFKFKSQWGSEPLPLHWYYLVRKGEMPEINPDNEKFSLAVKVWKKLPLFASKIIGPYLTRSLP